MEAAGGELVYAVELDRRASQIYQQNWGHWPFGDITEAAPEEGPISHRIGEHDVLAAGFPCQPFSKSGHQLGMNEARGTLFYNIIKIVVERKPRVVILENVRNLVGPQHRHEWAVIIKSLHDNGYQVSSSPAILSPHLLPPERGGRPQIRERVFITATRADDIGGPNLPDEVAPITEVPEYLDMIGTWNPKQWQFRDFIGDREAGNKYAISAAENHCIMAWDEWVQHYKDCFPETRLPGFPVWIEHWDTLEEFNRKLTSDYRDLPTWKLNFLRRNSELYSRTPDWQSWCLAWRRRHPWNEWRPSWRKLEWQAGDPRIKSTPSSLWDCLLQFRPSGLRVKAATYAPALVAITQTSIYGPYKRHLAPSETATLQGLPGAFSFEDQADPQSYKQLGNAVNVGVVWNAMRLHCARDRHLLEKTADGKAIISAFTGEDTPLDPTWKISDILKAHHRHSLATNR